MKKILLSIVMTSFALFLLAVNASDLFISEYIEGSSNNKAIEIFNGTGQAVDLSTYSVKLGSNGGAWGVTLALTGSLANNSVYVIANSSSTSQILALANATSSVANFNGDDAIGLFKNNELIDVFGTYLFDPGTSWNVAGTVGATLNHTLVRKDTVLSPTLDWATASGTNSDDSQWIVYAQDDFSYLGSHVMNTGAATSYAPVISNFTAPTALPLESEDHIITATVIDNDNDLKNVRLYFQINNSDPTIVTMTNLGNNQFSSKIPNEVVSNSDLVEYWLLAEDLGTGADYHLTTTAHIKYLAGITPLTTVTAYTTANTPSNNGIICRVDAINTANFHPVGGTTIDAYIQDANGAINVKKTSLVGDPFVIGNSYNVTGTVAIANNRIYLNPTSIIDMGVGVMPEALVIGIDQLLINPEQMEGMLVELQNVNVTDGLWPDHSVSATLTIAQTENASPLMLYVDVDTQIFYETEVPSGALTIKGIFTQYNDSYEIMPRSLSDIFTYQTLPVTFSSFTASVSSSNTVSLQWTTQSESNIHGYYIYRNNSNNQATALRVSSLISASNTSNQVTYDYTDAEVEVNNTYYYWIVSYELNSHMEWHGSASVTINGNTPPQPVIYTSLTNTYPNPFNSSHGQANIELKVKDNEIATLYIYNVRGQVVRSFNNIVSGERTIHWDGKDVKGNRCSNGIYFYKLSSPTITSVKKVMLIK